jgi:hypothetical protein
MHRRSVKNDGRSSFLARSEECEAVFGKSARQNKHQSTLPDSHFGERALGAASRKPKRSASRIEGALSGSMIQQRVALRNFASPRSNAARKASEAWPLPFAAVMMIKP